MRYSKLFCPADFGNVIVLCELIQTTIELLYTEKREKFITTHKISCDIQVQGTCEASKYLQIYFLQSQYDYIQPSVTYLQLYATTATVGIDTVTENSPQLFACVFSQLFSEFFQLAKEATCIKSKFLSANNVVKFSVLKLKMYLRNLKEK